MFKRKTVEPYRPTLEEEAEVRAAVKRQLEERLVGEWFWGRFADGRLWDVRLVEVGIDEFRLTVDWE